MQGMEPYDTEAALGQFGGHCCWNFEDTAPEDLTAAHGLDGTCGFFMRANKMLQACDGPWAFGGEEKLKSSLSLKKERTATYFTCSCCCRILCF